MTEFSQRLRRLRREAGLSQSDLAGDGLSPSYVSLLEAGKRSPSPEVVRQLAGRLGCPATALLDEWPPEHEQRIDLELARCSLAVELGGAADARRRLERLLAGDHVPARTRDDLRWLLAVACDRQGDLPAAAAAYRALFDAGLRGETRVPVVLAGLGLAACLHDAGDLESTVEVGEAALRAARHQRLTDSDDALRLAALVTDSHLQLGRPDRADDTWDRLLAGAAGQPSRQQEVYREAALLAQEQGRLLDAVALYERALGRQAGTRGPSDSPRLQLQLASLLLTLDPPRVESAQQVLDAHRPGTAVAGEPYRVEWSRLRVAVHLLRGDLDEADRLAEEALATAGTTPGVPAAERAAAALARSDVRRAQHRDDGARALLAQVGSTLATAPADRSTASLWVALAERLVAGGDRAAAADALRRALVAGSVPARTAALTRQVEALRERPRTEAGAPR